MLEIKTIGSLADLTFHIPSYQRGYRWETTQVFELLRDLSDFTVTGLDKKKPYILQPIVVEKVAGTDGEFVLIDGQQRLTTIYMLIHFLNSTGSEIPHYNFIFDKRKTQERFLQQATFADADDKSYLKNIDTFYMRKAYDAIRQWFADYDRADGDNQEADDAEPARPDGFELRNIFRSLLRTPSAKNKASIAVLRYDLDSDAMEAFDRLNYRRIKLTGTELVKAYLMASRQPSDTSPNNRAHAWDRMEKELQDPLFWSMLGTKSPLLGHIDFILNIVADRINDDAPAAHKRRRRLDEDKFNYYVIDNFFRRGLAEKKSWEEISSDVWRMAERIYNQIRNWFDNPEWFNLIGLWRRLENKNILDDLLKLEAEAQGQGKKAFRDKLLAKNGSIIHRRISALLADEEKADKTHPLDAAAFRYKDEEGGESTAIHNLMRQFLLAFNVMTLNDELSEQRFPFHLFDLYNETSLEHIHPQNIVFDHSACQIKKWTLLRIKDLEKERAETIDDDVKAKIDALKDSIEFLKGEFSLPEWDEEKKVREDSAEWARVKDHVAPIDRFFGDLAQISGPELHKISNMALVNQPTNSALSYHYLNVKRDILHERNQRRIDFERKNRNVVPMPMADDAMYLMPATERVFSKFYTKSSPGDMRLWRKEDRQAYMEALKTFYDKITLAAKTLKP